jgi:hypothetical protein
MKKILLCLLFPLSVAAQTDSLVNFYAKDKKMTWEQKYEALGKDAPTIKQILLEQLESMDGIEIFNSSNPDIIRGRMRDVVFNIKQYIISEVRVTTDAEFRITTKFEGYEVRLSSMYMNLITGRIAGNTHQTFESLNMKNNGKIIKSQKKALVNWGNFYAQLFKMKPE